MDAEDNPVLSLGCPHCGKSFASALRMDPRTFEAMPLESMIERCSVCAHASRFDKGDYFFIMDEGPS